MRAPRLVGLVLALSACSSSDSGGADAGLTTGDGSTSTTSGTDGGSTDDSTETGSDSGEETGGESDSGSGEETGTPPDVGDAETTGGEDECEQPGHELVFEQGGLVLEVTEEDPYWETQPFGEGVGFVSVRFEFDMQTVDNLDEIAQAHEGCPIYQALGKVGAKDASPNGEQIVGALFHYYKGGCVPGSQRLEVGSFLDYTAGTSGPWPPGELWHVVLEADMESSRVTLHQDGQAVGPTVSSSLVGVQVENTLNARVALGQAGIADDAYFPWFGATYSNVKVCAELAP